MSPSASRRIRKHGRTNDRTPNSKKRRTAKGKSKGDEDDAQDHHDDNDENSDDDNALAAFPPLLQGREAPEAVSRRRQLFTSLWTQLDDRIQVRRSSKCPCPYYAFHLNNIDCLATL